MINGGYHMSTIIEMKPLVGIVWGNKEINFNDSKLTVKATLGTPESVYENSYYYFYNELRIDFDKTDRVIFIEFLGGIESSTTPLIYGTKAFEVESEELYHVLEKENNGAIENSENGYSFIFYNSCVGIYREIRPEDVEEMIIEMRQNGIDNLNNEDLENDRKRAMHWAAIGIGKKGYYKEDKRSH